MTGPLLLKRLQFTSITGGTWYLDGYICSIKGLADPPIHLPKFSAQTHKPIHLPKFLPISVFKPIYLPKFDANPSIYQLFANFCSGTHLSTNISLFFGKMTHPSIYISLPKPIHLHRAYVSMKICEYPLGLQSTG